MTEDRWLRLHPRTPIASTVAFAGVLAVPIVPTLIGLVRKGVPGLVYLIIAAVGAVLVLGMYVGEHFRTRHTSLEIDGDRVRYRFDFVFHTNASVPRTRVRTVEITADPIQRLLGIATVRIGSGEKDGQITLRALDRSVAESLRAQLLARADVAQSADGERVGEISRWQPGWLRYAPLSIVSVALGAAAFGVPLQVASWFNAAPDMWETIITPVRATGLIAGIVIIAAIALLLGVIAGMAIHAEAWWGFRLERQPDGTLRIERGMLVRRSTVFEGSRIRGVVLVEPLGVRSVGGARLDLIALGLGNSSDAQQRESNTVMPAAPRADAVRVLQVIAGEPLLEPLHPHPPAARRKRLRWATWAIAILLGVSVALCLTLSIGWWLVALIAVLSAPSLLWLAVASYAALGHGFTGRSVVVRSGAIRRATHVLRREAIVSWKARQTIFQQRQGLATIAATTAAHLSAITAPDVGLDQAAAVLSETDERLWSPLLPSERVL